MQAVVARNRLINVGGYRLSWILSSLRLPLTFRGSVRGPLPSFRPCPRQLHRGFYRFVIQAGRSDTRSGIVEVRSIRRWGDVRQTVGRPFGDEIGQIYTVNTDLRTPNTGIMARTLLQEATVFA